MPPVELEYWAKNLQSLQWLYQERQQSKNIIC